MLTLHEFLAGIFAEECIVDDRSGEVVHHELEDRLNVLLCVAGIMCQSGVLQ